MRIRWSCRRWGVCIAALAVVAACPGCRSISDNEGQGQGQGQNQGVDGGGGLESTRIGGEMTIDELLIPAGTTVTVTSDLHIVSRGNVTIDGELIAEPSASNGYSITIEADGGIEVSGVIEAGDGAFAAAAPLTARTDLGDFAGGCNGGSVEMISHDGHVIIFMSARIRAGDGTDGRDSFMGSPGGRGGSVSLCAARDLTVRGSVHVGNGGNGGEADLATADLAALLIGSPVEMDALGRGATARFHNRGGDSGYLYATAGNFDFPFLQRTPQRTLYLDVEKYTSVDGGLTRGIIDGGVGGSAGSVVVLDPPTLIDDQLRMLRESPPTGEGDFAFLPIIAQAADAGRGWSIGGQGGGIAFAAAQWVGKDGKAIEAIGGKGGSVTSRTDPTSQCGEAVVMLNAVAGFGGPASATAAAGFGPSWAGGDGDGGAGGSAIAFGGNGRSSCFAPDQSGQGGYGSGGSGGGAEATGGNGGDGFVPGTPGIAQAIAGDGGHGGDGAAAAGLAGKGGLSNATIGFIGRTVLPGDPIPEHNNSDRPNTAGSGFNGLPGQTEELAPPDLCSNTDYECPGGQLCGALP